jgi:hypothetical protein
MEIGMIVTSTILIALCVLPFILIYGSTKQKEKQLKTGLLKAITKNNGTLSDYDTNVDFAIGLDRKANQIYFYTKSSETDYTKTVNLNDLDVCEVKKATKRIRNGKSNSELIENITLVFTNANGKVIDEFEIYDYDKSSQISTEITLADTWKKKVNELLLKNTKIIELKKDKKIDLSLA